MLKSIRDMVRNAWYGHGASGGIPSGDFGVDVEWSWSITARLAAIRSDVLDQLPSDVAVLIGSAKELHPEVAAMAAERSNQP